MTITIKLSGRPVPKRGPRFVRRGDKTTILDPQLEAKELARRRVHQQFGGRDPLEGPLFLSVVFYFRYPASSKLYHTARPDLDNLLGWVRDCGNGIVWKDDKQIVYIEALKAYTVEAATVVVVNEFDANFPLGAYGVYPQMCPMAP